MPKAWYSYGISQGFGVNGEKGVDLATPFHTPITALYAGQVRWAGRTQWACGSSGGEVTIVCNVPGHGVLTSYYLHLDQANVKVGDTVQVGQVIGLSGGQLSGGQWPVVNCPSRGDVYSTGPHTEFGFNAPWVSGPGQNIDPTFAILQARSGSLPATSPGGSYQIATTGTGASKSIAQIDPTLLEASMLAYYNLTSTTHKTINQLTGFDGICEALDQAEQYTPMNWLNPFGSILANAKAVTIEGVITFIAAMIFIIAVTTIMLEPVISILDAIAPGLIKGAAMAAAPEAAPAIAVATAPQATAR